MSTPSVISTGADSVRSTDSDGDYPGARFRLVFYQLGHFVSRWAIGFILICLVIAGFGAWKVVRTPHTTDLNSFASGDSISRFEHLAYQKFFDRYGEGISAYAFITAKDNGTMLRVPQMKAAVDVLDLISSKNFSIYDAQLNKSETFPEFCDGMCQINEPVRQFSNGLQIVSRNANGTGGAEQDRVSLIYPISTLFGRNMSVQPNFFGVKLNKNGAIHRKSNIKSVQLILFHFRSGRKAGWTDETAREWELKLVDYFQNEFRNEFVNVYIGSHNYIENELIRPIVYLTAFVAIGTGIMSLWLLLSTIVRCLYGKQLTVVKVCVILSVCLVPLLSYVTAIGFILTLGYHHSPLLKIQHLMAMFIGLYNIFHMVHVYICKQSIHELLTPGRRIAMIFFTVLPTHLTAALANCTVFGILYWLSVPAMQLFSLASIATITVLALHEIFLLGSILAIAAKFEMSNVTGILTTPITIVEVEKSDLKLASSYSNFKAPRRLSHQAVEGYANFMVQSLSLIAVLVGLWIIYMAVSIIGITQEKIDVTPPNLFMSDSVLKKLDPLRQNFILPKFTAAQVFVHNATNLSDPERLKKLNVMVEEFESLPGAWGRSSSNYFLPDFLSFRRLLMEETGEEVVEPIEFSDDDIASFLNWPEYKYWTGFLRLRDDGETGKKKMDGFFFNTIFHDPQLGDWEKHSDYVNQWRVVARKYRDDFNPTIYDEDSLIFETVYALPQIVWQSALFFIVCSAIAVALITWNLFAAFGTGFCVASILIGLFGISSWWNLPLDILLAFNFTVAGAITVNFIVQGFVYFSHAVRHSTPVSLSEQLCGVFNHKVFPILQIGIAVGLFLLCMVPATVVHVALVLIKLYSLCILFSSVHLLFGIPIAIAVVERIGHWWSAKRRDSIASSSTASRESHIEDPSI